MVDNNIPSIHVHKIELQKLEKELLPVDKKVSFAGRIWREIREGAQILFKSIQKNKWEFPESTNEKFKKSIKTVNDNFEKLREALRDEREKVKNNSRFPTIDRDLSKDVANRIEGIENLLDRVDLKQLNEQNKQELTELKKKLTQTFMNCMYRVNNTDIRMKLTKEINELSSSIFKEIGSLLHEELENFKPNDLPFDNRDEALKAYKFLDDFKTTLFTTLIDEDPSPTHVLENAKDSLAQISKFKIMLSKYGNYSKKINRSERVLTDLITRLENTHNSLQKLLPE